MNNCKNIYEACNSLAQNLGLEKHLRPIIVDLGGRHGESYELFGCNYPSAKYYFVEPSDRCIPHINKVIESYPNRDLCLIDGVLKTSEELIDFYQLDQDNDQSGNLFSDRHGVYGEARLCKVKSYDYTKLFSHIDFVKCNIEGAEYQLIEDKFFDIVDAFVMEAHNQHVPNKTYRDILSMLEDKFDLEVWGNTSYKYCFVNGTKKNI